MDIRNYSKDNSFNNSTKSKIDEASKIVKEAKKNNPKDFENMENTVKNYSSLSQDELLKKFFEVTKKQKEEGTLDANKIKQTYNMLYPILNSKQKAKLDELIKMII